MEIAMMVERDMNIHHSMVNGLMNLVKIGPSSNPIAGIFLAL